MQRVTAAGNSLSLFLRRYQPKRYRDRPLRSMQEGVQILIVENLIGDILDEVQNG